MRVADDANAQGDPDLEEVAERLFWWKTPECALSDPHRFVAQVMALGTDRDVAAVLPRYGQRAFEAVLDNPPPGVFCPRGWNYWHVRLRRTPVPPLPGRF